ncbi:MAG: putative ribosomal protein YlxQ [Candidatus Dichloromethanomonas elyunquensis]|nr:MAG: putative ribosomal protein YlxQ [Candidatus Dichloromethanomonas elyunquensis]
MNPKVRSLLGIARRAGKVCSGESQVEVFLKKQKGNLLVIAEDSPGANSKYCQWAKNINIPVLVEGTKEELGLSLGLSPRAIVLIMDRGFADAILKERGHTGC